jgi:hypothetical protein
MIITKEIQRMANAYARKHGCGTATGIEFDPGLPLGECKVVHRVRYGYRKNTTGEYVCNKYQNCFGWKNTYYQAAITVVAVNPE